MSDVVIRAGRSVSTEDIAGAQHLASLAYKGEIVLPVETLIEWNNRNGELFWIAALNERVIGYILALPLTPAAFTYTLSPSFVEKRLASSDIIPYSTPGDYSVYFCSIVVDSQYATFANPPKTGGSVSVSRLLRTSFLEDMAALESRGIIVREMSSEAVSTSGLATMQALGMKPLRTTNHGTTILYSPTNPSRLRELASATASKAANSAKL